MRYTRVSDNFWMGDLAEALMGDPVSLAVAFYLMTNSRVNMAGIYPIRPREIAGGTGLPLNGRGQVDTFAESAVYNVTDALAKLEHAGFLRYDHRFGVVWIVKFAKHDSPKPVTEPGDTRPAQVAKVLASINSESPLYRAFIDVWGEHFDLISRGYPENRVGVPRKQGRGTPKNGEGTPQNPPPTPTPTPTPSNSLPPLSKPVGRKAPTPALTDEPEPLAALAERPGPELDEPVAFGVFWAVYPKRVGRAAAIRAARAAQKAGWWPAQRASRGEIEIFEAKLKSAIIAQGLPERFRSEPQYVPNPATWINQRRMDDDPAAHRQAPTKRDLFLAELQAPAYSPPDPAPNPAADRYLDWAITLNLDTDGWHDVSRNVRIISDDGKRVVLEASDGMWSYLCDQGIEAALGHVERRSPKREPVSGDRGRLPGKISSRPIPH